MAKEDLGDMITQFKIHKEETGEKITNEDAKQLSEDTQRTLDK